MRYPVAVHPVLFLGSIPGIYRLAPGVVIWYRTLKSGPTFCEHTGINTDVQPCSSVSQVVQYLLENGANPVVEDAHGNTPADVAHNEEIKELIHVSADMREIHKSCA